MSDALVAYCAYCDDLGKLGGFVERTCNKHVSFHVAPEHYPIVGGILLETLEVVPKKENQIFNIDWMCLLHVQLANDYLDYLYNWLFSKKTWLSYFDTLKDVNAEYYLKMNIQKVGQTK